MVMYKTPFPAASNMLKYKAPFPVALKMLKNTEAPPPVVFQHVKAPNGSTVLPPGAMGEQQL